MRKILAGLTLVALAAGTASADTYVRGYTRSDGTYVAPHYRSAPDSNPYNNYSSTPNVNPYTGQRGTVNPYAVPSYGSGQYRSPYDQAPSRSRYGSSYGD